MGSIFKKPKIPTYRPAPTIVQRPIIPEPDTSDSDHEAEAEKARDIVRRASRGRGSTIRTSFRGVLGENNSLVPQRKNLLGE
jgi:hypothetical protein